MVKVCEPDDQQPFTNLQYHMINARELAIR